MSWIDIAWATVTDHCRFYVDYGQDQWRNLTPVKYTGLLVTIAVTGFLLMCRDRKR